MTDDPFKPLSAKPETDEERIKRRKFERSSHGGKTTRGRGNKKFKAGLFPPKRKRKPE